MCKSQLTLMVLSVLRDSEPKTPQMSLCVLKIFLTGQRLALHLSASVTPYEREKTDGCSW